MVGIGWVGFGAAVAAAKWTQLTGLSSSDGGLNEYGCTSRLTKGQKKMEGVNLRVKMHQTLMNRLCVLEG